MKRGLSKIGTTGVLLLSFVSLSFAQLSVGGILEGFEGTEGSVGGLIANILNWLIGAAGVVCVVMIIVAGYSYMTAGGDESKVKDASKTLTNAIIGLVICFIAVILVNFVLDEFLKPSSNPTPPPPAPGPGPTPVLF